MNVMKSHQLHNLDLVTVNKLTLLAIISSIRPKITVETKKTVKICSLPVKAKSNKIGIMNSLIPVKTIRRVFIKTLPYQDDGAGMKKSANPLKPVFTFIKIIKLVF